MYIQSYLQSVSGQVGALVEAAGTVQRINPSAVQSVLMLLGNRKAVIKGSGYKDKPNYIAPANDPKADYWAYVASQEAAGVGESAYDVISMSPGFTTLIHGGHLQDQLNGKAVDIAFVMTKDQQVVQTLAQPTGDFAVLQGPAVTEEAKKPEGIATPLIGGLVVGAVATAVAGPVAGVAAGLGTAALIHYAA